MNLACEAVPAWTVSVPKLFVYVPVISLNNAGFVKKYTSIGLSISLLTSTSYCTAFSAVRSLLKASLP